MERSVMMPTSEDPYERALRLLYGCMDLISEEECSYMSAVLPRDKGSVLSGYLANELRQEKPKNDQDFLRIIAGAMQEYLDHSRKAPTAQLREWEVFTHCLEVLAQSMGVRGIPELIKPVEDDVDIVLLKDLHEPHTKEELAEHLRVGEKTIRNKLRAIEDGTGGVRLGGQRVHVKISKTQEDSQTKCQYQTKNRMHPLILQLNTAQLGCLLTALAQDDIDYAINRITASYIWDQLSEYAKTRIKEIFVSRSKELKMLIEELESAENSERNDTYFLMERELLGSDELDLSQQLFLYMKGGRTCTITVREKGIERKYKCRRIEEGPDPDYLYLIQAGYEFEIEAAPVRRILVAKNDVVRVEESG